MDLLRTAGRWVVTGVVSLVMLAFLWAQFVDMVRPTSMSVLRYCSYGATSEQQYEGCVRRVDSEYVESSSTNAGRYGRGSMTLCLDDAGPLCGRHE